MTTSFFSPNTQFVNLGDALINRSLIRLAASRGPVILNTSRAPAWFINTLGVADTPNIRCINSFFIYLLILIKTALTQKAYLWLTPGGIGGHIPLKRAPIAIVNLGVLAFFKLVGVNICHIGASYEQPTGLMNPWLKARSHLLKAFYVRDSGSLSNLQQAGVNVHGLAPDLAFTEFPSTHAFKQDNLTHVGFSFRATPKDITAIMQWVTTAVACLPSQTELHLFAQVEHDIPTMQNMASHLQKTQKRPVTLHINFTDIDEMKKIYSGLDVVFSNRLHVLLLAASQGVRMVPVIHKGNRKIIDIFKTHTIEASLLEVQSTPTRATMLAAMHANNGLNGAQLGTQLSKLMTSIYSQV